MWSGSVSERVSDQLLEKFPGLVGSRCVVCCYALPLWLVGRPDQLARQGRVGQGKPAGTQTAVLGFELGSKSAFVEQCPE
jgi:hypothetical protein